MRCLAGDLADREGDAMRWFRRVHWWHMFLIVAAAVVMGLLLEEIDNDCGEADD